MNAARREAARSGALFLLTLASVTVFSLHGVLFTGSWREALAFSVPLMAIPLAILRCGAGILWAILCSRSSMIVVFDSGSEICT